MSWKYKNVSQGILARGTFNGRRSYRKAKTLQYVKDSQQEYEARRRKYLFSKGFRYRKNDARYPGKPDIVLSKYKTVIFIHGCFWHQHPGCKAARIPDTNSEFWKSKFEKNIARDVKEKRELEEAGWKAIVLWECEISTKKKREIRLPALEDEIKSQL